MVPSHTLLSFAEVEVPGIGASVTILNIEETLRRRALHTITITCSGVLEQVLCCMGSCGKYTNLKYASSTS